MDTLTLRALWLAAVDAPLAPVLGLLTGAGLALLGLCAGSAAVAWLRFLLAPGGPPRAPGARAAGAGASLLAWHAGRLGLAALGLALGARAAALVAAPGPDAAAALGCALAAVGLLWVRGSWTLWAAVLPLAPVPRLPLAYDVHRIAEAVARWDREAAGEVAPLTPRSREGGPAGVPVWCPYAGRPRASLTHRMPDM